jgi:16S rRNA (guanine966-N2)-methyltransferase
MRIIAGKFKGASLKSPKGLDTRPTPSRLREMLFNIVQHKIEGCIFLDLFAGSGLMGFEAISRGAKTATLIDNNFHSIQCIKSNVKQLGLTSEIQVFKSDVIKCLERYAKQNKQFDIIYVDPPYETEILYDKKTLLLSTLVLNLVDSARLLTPNGLLFIEEGHKLTIEEGSLNNLSFDRTKSCGKATLHQFSAV